MTPSISISILIILIAAAIPSMVVTTPARTEEDEEEAFIIGGDQANQGDYPYFGTLLDHLGVPTPRPPNDFDVSYKCLFLLLQFIAQKSKWEDAVGPS